MDNIIQCLKDNGYGELPEELGQEALDNNFDMRQGKAERILDYIFREEILIVAVKKDTAIDLDEKIRGYWLVRTSNLTERAISGIKIITQGQTQLAQVKKAITQTIVAKKREEVRDDFREAETERETALVDTRRPRISIFMDTVMMIKLTRFQKQSQIVQSSGTSWMAKNKKL